MVAGEHSDLLGTGLPTVIAKVPFVNMTPGSQNLKHAVPRLKFEQTHKGHAVNTVLALDRY